MEDGKAKSPYNAGRRIRWLAAGIVAFGVIYSAGWYWLAGRFEAAADDYVAAEEANGTAIDCAGREMRGYPFRLELFCTSLTVDRPPGELSIEAGALRSAAQIYQPQRIYTELDGPVSLGNGLGGTARLDWSLARGTVSLGNPIPETASIAVDDLSVSLPGADDALAAAHAEVHMRKAEDDLDLAWRYDGLVLDEELTGRGGLPVLAGDADISVENGVALAVAGIQSLRGVSGEIRRLALLVTPDQGLLVSGPFSVGADGLVDATLEVIVVDPAAFAKAFRPAFPEQAAKIDTMAAVPAQAGPDGTPEIRLPVRIDRGKATLGFIPLGQVPPLP